jgi:hypothetical protein
MQNRYRLQAAAVAAVVVLALGWASPAWAPVCTGCTTTSLFLRLSGVAFYPPTPIIPAGENVALDGEVHVVAHVTAVVAGNFLADIHLNMAGLTGVGQTTGNMYIGTGSSKSLDVAYPPVPIFPPTPIRVSFSLEPTNRGGNVPLLVDLGLIFNTDGTLLPSSTATLPACNADGCS